MSKIIGNTTATPMAIPDWNQNEPHKADHIKNRTHWAEDPVTTTEVTLEETTFEGSDEYGTYMHPAVLNFVDGAECTVTWDGVEYVSTCQLDKADGLEAFWIGNPVLCQVSDENNGMPFGIMTVPTYGMSQFASSDTTATAHTIKIVSTWTTQEIHKLDNKYIDAEWIAKKPIGYETIEILPETTVTAELEWGSGIHLVTSEIDGFPINGCPTLHITIDGVEYISPVIGKIGGSSSIICGNFNVFLLGSWGNGEPYMLIIDSTSLTLFVPTEGEHILKIIGDKPVYEQLPEGYLPGKFAASNTHSGSALSAEKLDVSAGSTTQPVYFNNGIPVAITHTLDKSVPANAVFTDTTYGLSQNGSTVTLTGSDGTTSSITISGTSGDDTDGGSGLPTVTTDDNGKTVKVVDGEWSVEKFSYNDLSDKPTLFSGNYNDLTNIPSTFTPSAHTHTIANVEGLQSTLDGKQSTITGAASTITSSNLTADKALVSDSSGKVAASNVTATELGYLSGVTGNIQEQLTSNMLAASLAMPGSLKWDGIIGDRKSIVVGQADGFNVCLVHVSDEYPEILTQISEGETIPLMFAMTAPDGCVAMQAECVMSDGVVMAEGVFIVPTDWFTLGDIIFPQKGVYFMAYHMAPMGMDSSLMYASALSIPGHTFADNSGSDASKYFEKTTGYSCGDTLTWDGNTDGLESVIQSQEGIPFSVGYYRVSSSVLTVDDVTNGLTATFVNIQAGELETSTASAEEAQGCFGEDGMAAIGMSIFNIPVDGYTLDGIVFPKAGIYIYGLIVEDTGEIIPLATSLTIPGYNFMVSAPAEVIKTEHLPKALQFGEIKTTIESDTITWDGNTDGLVQLDTMLFYKVSDAIPTTSDLLKGLSLTATGADGNSTSVNIPAEDVAGYIVEMPDAPAFYITLGGSEEDAVLYVIATAVDTVPPGVYLRCESGQYISSLTINGYKGFTTTGTELVKIDKKYLPDDIGGSGSGLPEVTADDNSKTVKVVNGEWAVEQMSYNDLSDKPTLGTLASKNSLTASDVGAVPTTRTVNGHALSANVTVTKSDVGLGNVENKSSATIRSEITKDNVTTALGYTPLAPGAQHISNKSSGTYYYKLGTMVADNSGNYGNITISGRLGGWEQSNSANFDIMMLNRSSARDGNTITATVSASGMVADALTKCDIVVYRQSDTSAIVYLKLNGYWLYDFDWNVYQHSISYSATNVTPTGTLVWSLSTAPKTILDASGKFYINGSQAATIADIEAAIGAAIAASY